MALLEEQFTETLQAGASPITYEGNEGKNNKLLKHFGINSLHKCVCNLASFHSSLVVGPGKKS